MTPKGKSSSCIKRIADPSSFLGSFHRWFYVLVVILLTYVPPASAGDEVVAVTMEPTSSPTVGDGIPSTTTTTAPSLSPDAAEVVVVTDEPTDAPISLVPTFFPTQSPLMDEEALIMSSGSPSTTSATVPTMSPTSSPTTASMTLAPTGTSRPTTTLQAEASNSPSDIILSSDVPSLAPSSTPRTNYPTISSRPTVYTPPPTYPCLCSTCTLTIWNTDADGSTCGDRIIFLLQSDFEQNNASTITEYDACVQVAGEEFPDNICGPFCDPRLCDGKVLQDKSGVGSRSDGLWFHSTLILGTTILVAAFMQILV